MTNLKLILVALLLVLLNFACNDNTTVIDGDTDGDTSTSDGDENTSDGDLDEDFPEMEQVELEEQVVKCEGSCDEYFRDFCVDDDIICICNDQNQLEEMNCLEGAESCPFVTVACQHDMDENKAVCMNRECPCETDDDCKQLTPAKDLCIADSNGFKECVNKCDVSNCSETVGCLDIGRPNGCGVCAVSDESSLDTCTTNDSSCGTNDDGYCTNLCGAFENNHCFETCNAIANSCQEGELCVPYNSPEDGKVTFGYCATIENVTCPSCTVEDGDMDSEEEIIQEEEQEVEISETEE